MPDSTATIRAWAQQNGHDVAERGRLPVQIREAYASAHQTKKPKASPAVVSKRPSAQAARDPRPTTPKRTPEASTEASASFRPAVVVPDELPVADGLLERLGTMEEQLATLLARVAVLEQPKGRFGRRSR